MKEDTTKRKIRAVEVHALVQDVLAEQFVLEMEESAYDSIGLLMSQSVHLPSFLLKSLRSIAAALRLKQLPHDEPRASTHHFQIGSFAPLLGRLDFAPPKFLVAALALGDRQAPPRLCLIYLDPWLPLIALY